MYRNQFWLFGLSLNVTIPKSFVLDQWIVTHVSGSSALRQVSTKISGVLNSQVLIFVIVVFKLMYIINKNMQVRYKSVPLLSANYCREVSFFRTSLNEKKCSIPEGIFTSQKFRNWESYRVWIFVWNCEKEKYFLLCQNGMDQCLVIDIFRQH